MKFEIFMQICYNLIVFYIHIKCNLSNFGCKTKEEIPMSEDYILRFATQDDLPQLDKVAREVHEDLMKQVKNLKWYIGSDMEKFKTISTEKESGCVIAETEEGIIGYLVFNSNIYQDRRCKYFFEKYYTIGKGFCIERMGVLPSRKGQDVLADMLVFFEKYAIEVGMEYLYGTIYIGNWRSLVSFNRYVSECRLSEETEYLISDVENHYFLIRKYFLAKI